MNAWRTGLRCLGHPLSLLSIGLLVLNDHILKAAAPSWWTGKLSDFAGLFFFPFLLAVLLAAVLHPFRLGARRAGRLAFGLTALGFYLIKLWPPANALAADAAGRLLGGPTRIALDPTDLVALVMLWPAWQLWVRAERLDSRRSSWVALAMASVATMATQPCMPLHTVERVAVVDGRPVLGLSLWEGGPRSVAYMMEGLLAWATDEDPPPDVLEEINRTVELPLTVCDPSDSPVCYRIDGRAQIERSTDGGQTWQVDWSLPVGRQAFLDRYPGGPIQMCAKEVDMGPYDMAFVDRDGDRLLVVAMGNEGIQIRTPDGTWERRGVLSAEPTQYAALSLGQAVSVVWSETALWLIGGVVVLFAISARSWGAMFARSRTRSWVTRPARIAVWFLIGCAVAVALMFAGLGQLIGNLIQTLGPYLVMAAVVLTPPFCFLWSWQRAASLVIPSRRAWAAAGWCLLTALAAALLGLMPLVLWAMGAIAVYELALVLSLGITVGALYIGVRRIDKASQAAGAAVKPDAAA